MKARSTQLLPWMIAVFALWMLVPWSPQPLIAEVDPSWHLALQVAAAEGLLPGRDLLVNFGPLGFLYFLPAPVYHPATFDVVVGAWSVLSLVFGAAYGRLLFLLSRSGTVAVTLAIAVVHVLHFSVDAVAYVAAGALLALHAFPVRVDGAERRPRMSGPRAAFLVVLAVLGLAKFGAFVAAVLVTASVGADELLLRRRVPWTPVVFSVLWLTGWLLAGASTADLGRWFAASLEISSAYPYGLAFDAGVAVLVVSGMAALALVAGFVAASRLGGRGITSFSLAGWIALLLLVLKAGLVLYDQTHFIIVVGSFLGLAALVVASLCPLVAARATLAGLATAALMLSLLVTRALPTVNLDPRVQLGREKDAAVAALRYFTRRADLDTQNAADLAAIRARFPLPPLRGGVDCLPYRQAVVHAWGARYGPRPVYQSYMAATPALAQANADFFAGGSAPETVLFDVESVDAPFATPHLLPALQDGRAWLELLRRYDVRADEGGFLVLERRVAPRGVSLGPPTTATVAAGEWMELATSGAEGSWAEVDWRRTSAGVIAAAAYKAPALLLEWEEESGGVFRARLGPDAARSGFLLSPAVLTRAEFAALLAMPAVPPRPRLVKRVRFTTEHEAGRWAYADHLTVKISAVHIAR